MLSEEEKAIDELIMLKHFLETEEKYEGQEREVNAIKTALNLIKKLKRKNEEKDRQIKALVKYIDSNNYVTSNSCDFQNDFKIDKCIELGDCKECIKKYFEEQTKN